MRPRSAFGYLVLILASLFCGSASRAQEQSDAPILYIGDSLSYGLMGTTIDAGLRAVSPKVDFISSCGSSPANWLTTTAKTSTVCGFWEHTPSSDYRPSTLSSAGKRIAIPTPKIADRLNSWHPRITVVQQGTNIANGMPNENTPGYENQGTYVRQGKYIDELMQTIKQSGSQCVWITPPNGKEVAPPTHLDINDNNIKTTRDLISKIAAKDGCIVVSALSGTQDPPGNNVHPGPTMARAWGDQVNQSLIPLITELLKAHPQTTPANGIGADLGQPSNPSAH